MNQTGRRDFLKYTAAVAAGPGLLGASARAAGPGQGARLLKSLQSNMLPKNLLDGDVNWPQVRRALDEVAYHGYLTTELSGGDEAYLTDLSQRVDKIIALKA
jgi:hypothetical protein